MKLIECPRDAMQGWKSLIPAEQKVAYINALLRVGFDTIDFGSFVSPKAIPQMADTAEVLSQLDLHNTRSKLLAIVANQRGAETACAYDAIDYLGFPFSVSETFQQRNTNSSISESLGRVEELQNLCVKTGKQVVIYISMGFGNPYGDPYSEEVVVEWVNKLVAMDIGIISLADTVGLATPEQVYGMTQYLVHALPQIEIGVHLHAAPQQMKEKMEAALRAGCRRFDGAIRGIGGCPMADDELVGNMDTLEMMAVLQSYGWVSDFDEQALAESVRLADALFGTGGLKF
jgi:hydroxymethylglutaryl-CoA lyase